MTLYSIIGSHHGVHMIHRGYIYLVFNTRRAVGRGCVPSHVKHEAKECLQVKVTKTPNFDGFTIPKEIVSYINVGFSKGRGVHGGR